MGKACSLTSSNWASASQLGRQGRPGGGRPVCRPVSQDWSGPGQVRLRVARPNCLFMERPQPPVAFATLSSRLFDFRGSGSGHGHRISLITQTLIAWSAAGSRQ